MNEKTKYFVIGWSVGAALVFGCMLIGIHFMTENIQNIQICPEPVVQKQEQPCEGCDCADSMSCKEWSEFLHQELSWRTRDLSSCFKTAYDNGVPNKAWMNVNWYTPEIREGQAKGTW